jgi:hypothetical protein
MPATLSHVISSSIVAGFNAFCIDIFFWKKTQIKSIKVAVGKIGINIINPILLVEHIYLTSHCKTGYTELC